MISTKGRYALRLMIDIATYSNGKPVSLKDVSKRQDISIKYLEQVVSLLVKSRLLISVRGNTGGYLNSAYNTASLFLNKGNIVYQLKNKDNKVTKYKAEESQYRGFDEIVIIINSSSASASEVLTLALKDNLNVKTVGIKSFGKGTVQETDVLSSGAMVKYTSGYWLGPNGESINEKGIEPDYEVKDSSKQLEKALEILK